MKMNRRVSITKLPRRHDVEMWKAWDDATLLMLEEARQRSLNSIRRAWEDQLDG